MDLIACVNRLIIKNNKMLLCNRDKLICLKDKLKKILHKFNQVYKIRIIYCKAIFIITNRVFINKIILYSNWYKDNVRYLLFIKQKQNLIFNLSKDPL
jgi:hypothetical protein